jgi:malate dehydrogenase (oxaloacetate-decarboxylating)
MQYKSIEYIPKIEPDSLEILSLIYTPGVGYACMAIKDNDGLSYMYTNRENSVAVFSFDYEKSLKRAIFLKDTLNIDAIPFECNKDDLKLVIENIYIGFCGIDLTLISDEVKDIDFDVEIPVLIKSGVNIKDFFKPFSKNIFNFDISQLKGDFKEQSLALREKAGGVMESRLSEEAHIPPVAIFTDGSAVLGFGNIGAAAGMPVMEGKAVLFKALGGVNAIPLCLKTQNSDEIIKIVQALKNSFSGINLEDISAPRCFDIEKTLIESLDIPVFHDDQHGTAIVVLAALLNALSVTKKKISEVKIVISGAGAAAQAVSKLLLTAGAGDIIHTNRKGIVYSNPENESHLEELAKITNKNNLRGTLEDALVGADVFIGLSTAGLLKGEFIKKMKENPIIFALANPTPEIMPDEAKAAGAFIVATGRSDFDNQINNSIAFPGLFRGLIDNKIKKVTNEIKLECALAIASLIKDEDLSPTHILPNALDPSVVMAIVNKLTKF